MKDYEIYEKAHKNCLNLLKVGFKLENATPNSEDGAGEMTCSPDDDNERNGNRVGAQASNRDPLACHFSSRCPTRAFPLTHTAAGKSPMKWRHNPHPPLRILTEPSQAGSRTQVGVDGQHEHEQRTQI